MSLTGKVKQFNLEFEYEIQSSLIDKLFSYNSYKHSNYTIIDKLKNHKLQKEETFKHKLETSITYLLFFLQTSSDRVSRSDIFLHPDIICKRFK